MVLILDLDLLHPVVMQVEDLVAVVDLAAGKYYNTGGSQLFLKCRSDTLRLFLDQKKHIRFIEEEYQFQ